MNSTWVEQPPHWWWNLTGCYTSLGGAFNLKKIKPELLACTNVEITQNVTDGFIFYWLSFNKMSTAFFYRTALHSYHHRSHHLFNFSCPLRLSRTHISSYYSCVVIWCFTLLSLVTFIIIIFRKRQPLFFRLVGPLYVLQSSIKGCY